MLRELPGTDPLPRGGADPDDEADLGLEVEPTGRAEGGRRRASGPGLAVGRVTGVPETTTDPARPW